MARLAKIAEYSTKAWRITPLRPRFEIHTIGTVEWCCGFGRRSLRPEMQNDTFPINFQGVDHEQAISGMWHRWLFSQQSSSVYFVATMAGFSHQLRIC